jgi:hypothetical protein
MKIFILVLRKCLISFKTYGAKFKYDNYKQLLMKNKFKQPSVLETRIHKVRSVCRKFQLRIRHSLWLQLAAVNITFLLKV